MLSSVRSRLLLWVLVPIAALLVVNVAITYSSAARTATETEDRMLLGAARVIGEDITYDDGAFEAIVPPAALELFQSAARDEVFYSVIGAHGELLTGYTELPLPAAQPETDAWTFYDAVFRDEPVRVVSFTQPIFGAPGHPSVRVQVSQTLRSRTALAHAILFRSLGQQGVLVLLVVLALWLGLTRALEPVVRLSEAVRSRRPGTLEPLETSAVPSELKPLVAAINDYVSRLESQMSAHSRFIGNAAHQLRTPLALLNAQVAVALRSGDDNGKDEAIRSIRATVQHGTRVVNQLLMLSMAESGTAIEARDVDLVRLVQDGLEHCAAAAQYKGIDLGFELHGEGRLIHVAPSMMRELVANLLDNAVRYTPSGGTVTAKVSYAPDAAELCIEDNGPGIPPGERERVFERFYRLHHDASDGCGLGLAIVREIAVASGAQVTLGDGPGGRGLAAKVRIPLSPAAPAAPLLGRGSHFAASANSVV